MSLDQDLPEDDLFGLMSYHTNGKVSHESITNGGKWIQDISMNIFKLYVTALIKTDMPKISGHKLAISLWKGFDNWLNKEKAANPDSRLLFHSG